MQPIGTPTGAEVKQGAYLDHIRSGACKRQQEAALAVLALSSRPLTRHEIAELAGMALSGACGRVAELPPLAGDLPLEATVSLHHGHAIPRDLLERCAAMHLTLLAQAREAAAAGEPGAESELAWLYETGEQLLAAGGAW